MEEGMSEGRVFRLDVAGERCSLGHALGDSL